MSSIHSATNLNLHLYVIDKLFSSAHNFNLNKSFIVEAGVYKGAMTCSLSLAAKMLGTKLIVYDSFEGLPDIKKKENIVKYHHMKKTSLYKIYTFHILQADNFNIKFCFTYIYI